MRTASAFLLTAALAALPGCGARSQLNAPPAQDQDGGPIHREDCLDAGLTYIYVVTSQNELLSFDPAAGQFAMIGALDCVDPTGSTPFSMAVDRKGHAYVVFTPSGSLFKVSTVDAHCEDTGFTAGQNGFVTFGMGFSTNAGGPDETLFIAESSFGTSFSKGLATIDTSSFQMSPVAPFDPDIANAVELTGTGDGRLYGLFIATKNGYSTNIAQIDKATGQLSNIQLFSSGLAIDSFAFAFWGGQFYVFHAAAAGPTTVTRFDVTDGTSQDVAMLNESVVGVGVSTCAPEQ